MKTLLTFAPLLGSDFVVSLDYASSFEDYNVS